MSGNERMQAVRPCTIIYGGVDSGVRECEGIGRCSVQTYLYIQLDV